MAGYRPHDASHEDGVGFREQSFAAARAVSISRRCSRSVCGQRRRSQYGVVAAVGMCHGLPSERDVVVEVIGAGRLLG